MKVPGQRNSLVADAFLSHGLYAAAAVGGDAAVSVVGLVGVGVGRRWIHSHGQGSDSLPTIEFPTDVNAAL